MSEFSKPVEKRQFGRRKTCWRGWVTVRGRPRIPCIIRNFTVEGALLEFDMPTWMSFNFHLSIEGTNFESECEIRHQGERSCGVMFIHRQQAEAGRARTTIDDVVDWKGTPAQPLRF